MERPGPAALACIAQFELNRISERMKSGLVAAPLCPEARAPNPNLPPSAGSSAQPRGWVPGRAVAAVGQLPLPNRRDIRAIFSNYRRACEEADVALLAVGEMERVSRAARGSSVGKLTPSAIYVHESALESLPPLLRLYEGCARGYIGRVDGANLVKLHTGELRVSYLSYPDFESDPHPALASSMTVHLQTFRVRKRDYTTSQMLFLVFSRGIPR